MKTKIKFFNILFTIKTNMALTDPAPITGWEKWINRIVTVALAAWSAIQYLLTHWAASPPTV